MKTSARLSFSLLLPLIELVVWVVLVAVPASLVFLNLERAAQGSGVAHLQSGAWGLSISGHQFLWYAIETASIKYSHTIAAVNLPGFVGELLISLPTSWPTSWHPSGISLDAWRALTFPFFSIPAWWLVGAALDSLLARRPLHWAVFLIGSTFFVLFAVIFLGFQFALSASERGEVVYPLWGIGLWTLLFGVLPVGWFRQWRSLVEDRRIKDSKAV